MNLPHKYGLWRQLESQLSTVVAQAENYPGAGTVSVVLGTAMEPIKVLQSVFETIGQKETDAVVDEVCQAACLVLKLCSRFVYTDSGVIEYFASSDRKGIEVLPIELVPVWSILSKNRASRYIGTVVTSWAGLCARCDGDQCMLFSSLLLCVESIPASLSVRKPWRTCVRWLFWHYDSHKFCRKQIGRMTIKWACAGLKATSDLSSLCGCPRNRFLIL